jgi:hypothetical protein
MWVSKLYSPIIDFIIGYCTLYRVLNLPRIKVLQEQPNLQGDLTPEFKQKINLLYRVWILCLAVTVICATSPLIWPMMFYDVNWFEVLHSIGMISTTLEFAITFQMTVLIQIPLLYISDRVEGMDRKDEVKDVPYNTTTEDPCSRPCVSESVHDGQPRSSRSDGTIDYSLE